MKINKKEELEKAAKDLLNLKESINLLDIIIRDAALEDIDSLVLQGIVKKYNKVYEEQLTHYDEMRSNGK
jgi:5-methylcytosine-specific restriction endonuclease McrBC regulatory subunit McrC